MGTVLGVERSVSGRLWRERLEDWSLATKLAQTHGLPEIVARVLAARGVTAGLVETFLKPTLRALLPDPSRLRDMDRAAGRLARAIETGEAVAVFGDYDVDGATSAALLHRFFKAAGRPLRLYIPDRMREGYGPNAPALRRLKDEGVRLVVTVDCGITAYAPLAEAAEIGLDVIVVDHHVAEAELPRAVAVVNPNRLDESGALRQLAAVGVAFLLAVAVNRELRGAGWWTQSRPEPDLLDCLDLVALGTVCDVVPLTGLNRALVTQGLKVMAGRRSTGLAALADAARLTERPGAFHCGFLLGPRVNAGGRVGDAELGVRLLTSEDPAEAAAIAQRLDRLNEERRAIEQTMLEEAIGALEAEAEPGAKLAFVARRGWHAGVIGIVASRVKERYALPAVVAAIEEDGTAKGSGRSVRGVDLGSAVLAARQSGLLINGGGHAMAAGFTARAEDLPALKAFLSERLARQIDEGGFVPTLGIDGVLQPGGATVELTQILEQVGPFGAGNAEPRFAFPAVRLTKAEPVGENHVRCILIGSEGGRLKAIAFRALGTPLGDALLQARGAAIHLAGHLRADIWQGQATTQLLIEDAAAVA
ncbi:MAG TPA: single-stranded-DNA-specific exonuclease RecJ [Alphaproteobacteria bacterium]|nr:single-stranded-DNA-specific exonuclease RecJ [Alphaproteobacteria bacterium]